MKSVRLALLGTLYFLAVFAGIRAAVLPPGTQFTDLALNLTALVVTQLCIVDSRIISKPLVHGHQWVMFFSWPLSAPIYLLWSRKGKGLLLLLLHTVLLYATYMVVAWTLWFFRWQTRLIA